jgi:5-deoxy-D-glucuronate isomerase
MGTLKTLASPQLGSSAFVSVSTLEFETAGTHVLETGGQEHVLNILTGTCSVRVDLPDGQRMAFDPVGRRDSIFGGKPEAVYIPVNSRCEVTCSKAPFEAAIFAAPTDQTAPPAHITPEEVRTVDAGKSDWQRQVHILMGDSGPATRMMLGETESPPGNWSGFPPHRHTRDNPHLPPGAGVRRAPRVPLPGALPGVSGPLRVGAGRSNEKIRLLAGRHGAGLAAHHLTRGRRR